MTTTMMMRMTMRMKTMSLRAAAPALPLQGTPQTLTPTETQPPPWADSQGEPTAELPSPTDHLCLSLCSVPSASPTFFLYSFFKKKFSGGRRLHEPRLGLCGLGAIGSKGSPGTATIRLSQHWTGAPHPLLHLQFQHGQWTGEFGGGSVS